MLNLSGHVLELCLLCLLCMYSVLHACIHRYMYLFLSECYGETCINTFEFEVVLCLVFLCWVTADCLCNDITG